jgi:hypothetical protein
MKCFYKISAYFSSVVDIIFKLLHTLLFLPCYDGGARGLGKDSLTSTSNIVVRRKTNERKTRNTKIATTTSTECYVYAFGIHVIVDISTLTALI